MTAKHGNRETQPQLPEILRVAQPEAGPSEWNLGSGTDEPQTESSARANVGEALDDLVDPVRPASQERRGQNDVNEEERIHLERLSPRKLRGAAGA